MDNFDYIFQINTGSFTNRHYSEQDLLKNIKRLFSFVKAKSVILGWFPDSSMYKSAVDLIHQNGADAYLWLPVFADLMPSLGLHGFSTATQTASADEQFEFVSPDVGTEHVIKQYNAVAGNVVFDGVFLDRIRYGIPSEDLDRAKNITKAAKELTSYFHSKNMKVGLDSFAPHLALYMGQDSQALGEISDFIKPMMYWATNAPAGIPYEEKVFEKTLNKKIKYDDVCLEELTKKCNVYPGIEVNNYPKICSSTPEYVREKIDYFKKCGCKGAVLSWNSPDATDEMLRQIT